ncbi:hypothetical protein [Flagellimonas sp. CMM7]|uniref:hypothetical protein n=1 Tax=Flagellimonas sp. CMM7 TaxID=2654676 RepID=UPI0013D7964D|nr:hypothetical protein [Flagellimonas sp. CMM7]UII80065.1 hypothetical protein LV704_00740 [Flagellimonas sp. CMM7]
MKKTNTILTILAILIWGLFLSLTARAQLIEFGTTYNETIITGDFVSTLGGSFPQNTGHCESKTQYGKWEDSETQYVANEGYDVHEWAYDERKSHHSNTVLACLNCCSIPEYSITQNRVCKTCGWHQDKTDWVLHGWIFPPPPPKTSYEIVMERIKQ